MSNSAQADGHFFIGCGSMREIPVFYFYYKDGDGAIRLDYKRVDRSVIYEDTDNAYVIINYNETCEFHVPKNSVIRTFELNVKDIGK